MEQNSIPAALLTSPCVSPSACKEGSSGDKGERAGEPMRQDSGENNAKLNAGTMNSHAAVCAVFASEDKNGNEPN